MPDGLLRVSHSHNPDIKKILKKVNLDDISSKFTFLMCYTPICDPVMGVYLFLAYVPSI